MHCEKSKQKTTHKKKTLSPEWNEKFTFNVKDTVTAQLELNVKDYERFGKNVTIGTAKVALDTVAHNTELVLPLEPANTGTLYIHIAIAEQSSI